MAKVEDIWYRYVDVQYAAPLNEWDEPCGPGTLAVNERQYRVTKVTPKGVRLDGERLVLDSSNKKFACPTKELAKESFIKRKERQASILRKQLARAERSIKIINGQNLLQF